MHSNLNSQFHTYNRRPGIILRVSAVVLALTLGYLIVKPANAGAIGVATVQPHMKGA